MVRNANASADTNLMQTAIVRIFVVTVELLQQSVMITTHHQEMDAAQLARSKKGSSAISMSAQRYVAVYWL